MANTHPTYYKTVDVVLSNTCELHSNVTGEHVQLYYSNCNNKHYSFLYDPTLELAVDDLVVCQACSGFIYGKVVELTDRQVDHDTYLENVVLEEGAHKLVVAKIDWSPVKLAVRAKRLYALEKRKAETRARLNVEAFNNVKENL